MLVALIGLGFSAFSQNVVIQTNETKSENTDGSKYYWINGISSKEDIGGVDVETTRFVNYYAYTKIVFTNYNSSNVTVYYEIKNANGATLSGSKVLKPNESKTIVDGSDLLYTTGVEVKTITRKL
ncbi:MAG: hypothetical protein LBU83_08340 [Bacteroidales bacterium]|jgi:hypothetical protein|nr:hypothetical protein [Bacteroidales bacterium]